MSFEEKGYAYRSIEENQVDWGMKLLKIAVILLVISFSIFFIESLVETFTGIGKSYVEPVYSAISLGPYVFLSVLLYIHNFLITIAILTLTIGLFCLSKIIPAPANNKMKIIAYVFLSIILVTFIVGISANIALVSMNNSYKYAQISNILVLIQKIMTYLILSIGGLLIIKQVTKLSEIQGNGTVGGKNIPIVAIVFYGLWIIGKIVYYAILLNDPYITNEILVIVLDVSVYVENIGQLLYAAFAMIGFIITLIKLRKLSVEEIAMASTKLY
ncbi:MAG: hypothetical protein ACFFDW_06485 [Candidatus Thorarchaeota archaeon]